MILPLVGVIYLHTISLTFAYNIKTNDLNIPDPIEVPKSNYKLYEAYDYYSNALKATANLKASPCNNFYNYTCEHTNVASFLAVINDDNTEAILRGIKTERNTTWYKTFKARYENCLKLYATPENMHQNGKILQKIYKEIDDEFGSSFPLFDKTSNLNFGSNSLGELIGYLAQKFRLNTFLSYEIQGTHLALSEPQLAFPNVYFVNSFDKFEAEYKASVRDYLTQLAEALNVQLDEAELTQTIDEVVKFEKELAEVLNTVEEETPITLEAADLATASLSINVNAFFARISKNFKKSKLLNSKDFDIHVTAPAQQTLVQMFISQSNPKTVLNYLNIRLARSLRQYYMRKPKECKADQWLREGKGVKATGFAPPPPEVDVYPEATYPEIRCVIFAKSYLQPFTDRVYLDDRLPDMKLRREFVERISNLTHNIINGFKYQIDQLTWFTQKSKQGAYKKIDALLYNIVYDKWLEDDNRLDDIAKDLNLDEQDDFYTQTQKLNNIIQARQWANLFKKDRNSDFTTTITMVNAWYNRNMNHFFIPLGILQRPLFDINYPAALQYDGISYIIGHELTHGFDSNGVKYDGEGEMNPWMDNESTLNFNKMANCVINEYNRLHGRGKNTQTEDIADNGGIRAAYNAFKSEQSLYGQDLQIPGAPFNHLNQDQLFFSGFAHLMCSNNPKPSYSYDVHSPWLYRAWGTLQNFPAFRTAYNCPAGSEYSPVEHCNVWA
ncbi:unnamed protein product [Bursaphelenchus okinawaensis]|uniref:Peptidase_M13 domain-containing protein n=1 Tax=Bursaphelenchus okinawaensis TaxID=465554 RepID=A0A811L7Y4_9BILA|nr:unnamed protein product [Bursaphelenchus okinawaensis]CAG9118362.1 unnamed protein product [Bursaphelenchus okinawaensis]